MPNESGEPVVVSSSKGVGRQPHLPFKRAFKISMNSLKIRFWRSTITAGGIFLGIAFLATILTQQLMQWPLPEKIDPGYLRIAGQVVNPYDFETWKPVPVEKGLKAGIPKPVLDDVTHGACIVSFTAVVTDRLLVPRGTPNNKTELNKLVRHWAQLHDLNVKKFNSVPDGTGGSGEGAVPSQAVILTANVKGQMYAPSVRADFAHLLCEGENLKSARILASSAVPSFSLTEVVQGMFQAKRADKNYARVMREWRGLKKLKLIQVYVDAKDDKDIKVADAIKAGVPRKLANRLATKETIAGGLLVAEVKKNPAWAKPVLAKAALGRPIALSEVTDLGVPESAAAKLYAGVTTLKPTAIANAYGKASKAAGSGASDAAKSAARKLRRELRKLYPVVVFANAGRGWNMKATDAALAGVPKKTAGRLVHGDTFKGSALVEVLKDKPKWVKPIYYSTALDLDIFLGEADQAGVPDAISRLLAGEGKSFKGSALNEAIQVNHPKWMAIWRARVKRYAVFKTVPKTATAALDRDYAITLDDVFAEAKTPTVAKVMRDAQGRTVDADLSNVMIVNANGRRESVNLQASPAKGAMVKMSENDYILVPDRNSKYRMIWLVVMSLLVCTVGISNSMLMAVTERFKEIGTMKCLGATDSFVRTLFILESSMLGIVASVLGWVVGFVLMVFLAAASKGWDIVGTMSAGDIARTFVYAVVVGLLVTIAATIAPAQRAARMPAAMALRTEI